MQLWLNQESNQQTVNIKSKEVYLSQQTQTPITEVVRTEKVNWLFTTEQRLDIERREARLRFGSRGEGNEPSGRA